MHLINKALFEKKNWNQNYSGKHSKTNKNAPSTQSVFIPKFGQFVGLIHVIIMEDFRQNPTSSSYKKRGVWGEKKEKVFTFCRFISCSGGETHTHTVYNTPSVTLDHLRASIFGCKEKTESNREEILTGFSPSCLALLWAVVVYSNGFIYSSVKIGIKPITHMPIRDGVCIGGGRGLGIYGNLLHYHCFCAWLALWEEDYTKRRALLGMYWMAEIRSQRNMAINSC